MEFFRVNQSKPSEELMASKSRKKVAAETSREDLEKHVAAFLKAGGKVQQIPTGGERPDLNQRPAPDRPQS